MANVPGGGGGSSIPSYVPHQYDSWVTAAAHGSGLPIDVVAAQINDESGFQPGVTSSAGAEGIAQFEPATYAGVGGKGSEYVAANELQPYITLTRQNLRWAGGDVRKALAAYNAGQGNWQAGLGYADTILSNAGQKGSLNVQPGTGATGGTQPIDKTALHGSTSAQNSFLTGIEQLLGFGLAQQAVSGISDTASGLDTLALPFVKIADGVDWLFHPNHWIRIFAGLGGGVALIGGVYSMTHVGKGGQAGGSVAGVPVGVDLPSSSLPMSIGLLGLGFLGLFIAFHNVPDSINDFPSFLGWVAGNVRNPATTAASNG